MIESVIFMVLFDLLKIKNKLNYQGTIRYTHAYRIYKKYQYKSYYYLENYEI